MSSGSTVTATNWTGIIDDDYGHIVAYVDGEGGTTATTLSWQQTRSIGYGPAPDSPVFYVSEGATLAQATAWRGKRQDITGFYWMGARYYEPTSGRFLSPDPFGHAASMSLYDYASGDPVNFVDPTGRMQTPQLDMQAVGKEVMNRYQGLPPESRNAVFARLVENPGLAEALGFPDGTTEWFKQNRASAEFREAKSAEALAKLGNIYRGYAAAAQMAWLLDKTVDDPASDNDVTPYQMFYQFVNGTGKADRSFNENSVMGQGFAKVDYVQEAIADGIKGAQGPGESARIDFVRRASREPELSYGIGLVVDVAGFDPVRGFQGSIQGKVWVRNITNGDTPTNFADYQITIMADDTMGAESATHCPDPNGNYIKVLDNNPFGPNGPMRTINVHYNIDIQRRVYIGPPIPLPPVNPFGGMHP